MKSLLKLAILLVVGWSGYWYIGARAQEKLYASAVEGGRASGWQVQSRNLGVEGFPGRFDTTLTGLDFRTPNGKWGWQGDRARIAALSYQPTQATLTLGGAQVFTTPEGSIRLNGSLMQASVAVTPTVNLPLARLALKGAALALQGLFGAAKIATLNAELRPEGPPNSYRLKIDLAGIAPPASLTSLIGGGAGLPDKVDALKLSSLLEFDREINRQALESGTPPRPGRAIIAPSTLVWGRSVLTVTGDLRRANNGYIEGSLGFEVENWQTLYNVFTRASALAPTQKITLQRALNAASNGGNLVFTLVFENGQTRIGPFTIGPAPVYPF